MSRHYFSEDYDYAVHSDSPFLLRRTACPEAQRGSGLRTTTTRSRPGKCDRRRRTYLGMAIINSWRTVELAISGIARLSLGHVT
jgi:hypothetical protein